MTAEVFESATADQGDDDLGIRNTLSIEAAFSSEHWGNDERGALVHVDTNYKATRTSEYPVNLTLVDAVKASAALLRATLAAYGQTESSRQRAWDLLREIQALGGDLEELREVLLIDLKPNTED